MDAVTHGDMKAIDDLLSKDVDLDVQIVSSEIYIMITCPCYADPLTSPFYIVKLYILSYFCSKTEIVITR